MPDRKTGVINEPAVKPGRATGRSIRRGRCLHHGPERAYTSRTDRHDYMSKSTVQQQFGANAAHYVTSQPHAQGASLARLVELVGPQPDWLLLDVATAAGHTALAFAPHVAHATGIGPDAGDVAVGGAVG